MYPGEVRNFASPVASRFRVSFADAGTSVVLMSEAVSTNKYVEDLPTRTARDQLTFNFAVWEANLSFYAVHQRPGLFHGSGAWRSLRVHKTLLCFGDLELASAIALCNWRDSKVATEELVPSTGTHPPLP